MKLTKEQQQEILLARERGESRTVIDWSSDQKQEWQLAVKDELAGKSENIEHHRRIKEAASQAGFFGDLRRAMLRCRCSLAELAIKIDVEPRLLSDFRADLAPLPPESLAKLVDALGLRLMQEIK